MSGGVPSLRRSRVSVTDTTLSNVRIYRFDPEANHTDQLFEDQTNQTDDACRSYTPPSPVQLQGTDVVYAEYFVDFPGGGGQGFIAGAVTFNMTP